MAGIYDRADIYDLIEDEGRYEMYRRHWEAVLNGKNIHSLLDVSIGSGSMTLPLTDLGVTLSGSDLSRTMLEKCAGKAAGKHVELQCSDFRTLDCWAGRQFDCVASTGNSLPYVTNADVEKTLEGMDALVAPGGYLYADIRNWDWMLREKPRFYTYNPIFRDGNRINFVQLWDYNPDGTMTFNLLFTFEKDNRVFQKEIFEEHYHPISRHLILEKLAQMGYVDMEVMRLPAFARAADLEKADWHTIIARKPL
ncbi:MAG: class I SAM-dependent methyltransferase [Eubacteriales bacterium]|nr:class I SAM-dependent methyltransferase [Eubacteriales bacterium]